jgi:hypothetical protein
MQTPETTMPAPPHQGPVAAAHARRWHVLAVLSLVGSGVVRSRDLCLAAQR